MALTPTIGIDLHRFKPSGDRMDFKLPRSVILCVASLNRGNHKRVELTLESVLRLPDAIRVRNDLVGPLLLNPIET